MSCSKLGLCHDNSTGAACWGDPKPQISTVPVLATCPSDAHKDTRTNDVRDPASG